MLVPLFIMIEIILMGHYNSILDMNFDNTINIIDIVILINQILGN